jgi:hypothetical protein
MGASQGSHRNRSSCNRLLSTGRVASVIIPEDMTNQIDPSKSTRFKVLAIFSGLLPWFGGLLVTLTRSIFWLALAGVLICVLSSTGAYLMRKSRDPVSAKHWLIVEPVLFGSYYLFAVVLIRYVFLR